jgi:peptide/nickel transport system permease protein
MKTQAISVQPQAASKRPPQRLLALPEQAFPREALGAIGAVVAVVFLFVRHLRRRAGALRHEPDQPRSTRLKPPSWALPFGTDNLGRDMLSRCLYGAQLSVIIGLTPAALATVISALLGIITGYLGGKVDLVIQRFVDAWMSFPAWSS